MNKGFIVGTKYKFVSDVVESYDLTDVKVVELKFSNDTNIICGENQEFMTLNGWVEAKDLCNCILECGEKVISVNHLTQLHDTQDYTVAGEEHYFYIVINDLEIKVHNLSIGKYLSGGSSLRVNGVTVSVRPQGNVSSTSPVTTTPTTQKQEDTTIYIPETEINFTVSMMKPNTRLYAFFDGKDVSQYVKPANGVYGEYIITDNTGYVAGTFKIPNNSSIKFIAGRREFVLTDSSTNGKSTTFASATYIYTGTSENPENPNLDSSSTTDQGEISPLIQSFYCGERGGMYISKVGLYFYGKDSNQSILFQIREVKEDKVLSGYVAGSSVTINPSDITVSTDPLNDTPTWIEFPNPIYLTEGKEYAIFLVTNSPYYVMHMVDYGQQTNNVTATKDISSRSLIKYAGINNWIRDNARGLKYTIQKCKFDTTKTYNLSLGNTDLGFKLLPNNSLSVRAGDNTVTVTDPNHSFSVGGFVTIRGLADGNYAGLSSTTINGVHTISEVTWDTYSFSDYWNPDISAFEPTSDATSDLIFGTNIETDYDYQYDNLVLNMNSITLTGAELKYSAKTLSGQSLDGIEDPYVMDTTSDNIVPQIMYTPSKVRKIASQLNSDRFNLTNNKSLNVVATFKTNNENISPMIDKYNMNVIAVENLINNKSDNELTGKGNACARKIWKTIKLYEQATGLKVTFKGAIQANTNVKVYYKVLGVDENISIDSKDWVEMTLERDVAKSLSENDFQDYNYLVDELPPFKSFKTKIVLNSTDSTKVPLIRKYAAIAFAE